MFDHMILTVAMSNVRWRSMRRLKPLNIKFFHPTRRR